MRALGDGDAGVAHSFPAGVGVFDVAGGGQSIPGFGATGNILGWAGMDVAWRQTVGDGRGQLSSHK